MQSFEYSKNSTSEKSRTDGGKRVNPLFLLNFSHDRANGAPAQPEADREGLRPPVKDPTEPTTEGMLDDTEKQAFDHAIRYLGNREHSRHEIVSKLERRGFSAEAIEKTLQRLESLALLDDRAFAMHYIGSRSRKKPSGRYKLRYELLKKGVAEEIVDEVLGDFDSAEHCLNAALRKLPLLKGDLYYRRRKLHVFLTGRGFDGRTVRETLDKVFPS